MYVKSKYFSCLGFVLTCAALGQERSFSYFGSSELDYWNNGKTAPVEAPRATITSSDTKDAFSWKKYLDPRNKEFFREGDYTPPEPFMEIVRNPSDENLKLWFQYIEKKNDLSARLQTRMAEYLRGAQSGSLPAEAKTDLEQRAQKVASQSKSLLDTKRFRFRMYFDSTCPHCRRMFDTLGELARLGFFVEARQIDTGPLTGFRVTVPVERATAPELKARSISSVPLLLAGDLERKVVLKMTGYKSPNEVIQAIRAQDQNGVPP
jgi:hypothetical protein